jgi:enamine deaminase RidA (YjgF/YER057c/UK114 family)
MSHEERLKKLHLELPTAAKSMGLYKTVFASGGLAYLSGHGPIGADGTAVCGKLGVNLTKEQGYEAARRTALNALATLRQEFGSLDAIRRVVKTTGFVNAAPDFNDAPAVINGFSEIIRDVFGPEAGIGARSSLGVAALPAGWAVEVELIVELEDRNQ